MKLRKYQQDILDNIDAERAFGSSKLVVDLTVGGGKSLVISSLCKQYPDEKVVILTNITKLIGQIASHLDEVGVDYSILKAGLEGKFDPSKRVQLVMEQTLHARDIDLAADIIIRDEGHVGTSGDRYKSIVKSSGCDLEVLFSGTCYDSFGVQLDGYDLVKGLTTKEATSQGYLTPAITHIAKFTKDLDFSDIGASGDYSANELDEVINNDSYNLAVVDAYKLLPKQPRRTIVFVSSIEHSDALAAMFNSNDIAAKSVHSKNTEEACFEQPSDDGLLIEVESRDIEVIISVNKIAIGFDDTSINTMINCRPTKVRSLYHQMCGRAIRLHSGQESVDILDCSRATVEHGFYDLEYVAQPNRIEARKLAKLHKTEIVDYALSQSDTDIPLIVDSDGLEALVISLASDESIDGLKAKFELCTDINELLDLLVKIAPIVSPHKFSRNFVAGEVVSYVEEGGNFKAIKTRANNILKQGKKLNALKFFPEWLKEQRWG